MEPAVIDSNPTTLKLFENIGIALVKPNVGMIVRFAGMNGLRRNNIIARHHDHKRYAGRLHGVSIEIVEGAFFVEDVKKRPGQRERRMLILLQRKLREASQKIGRASCRERV